MQTLVIDPRFGAAGDMIVSALLSLGADKNTVLKAIKHAASPKIEPVVRNGTAALSIKMHAASTHRTIDEVLARVREADAPEDAKLLAEKIFSRIEKAEAAVHGTPHPHFHEIGADDAAADVLAACTALYTLHADNVCILPVATGFGELVCSHGTMPVPAPATAEILKNSDLDVVIGNFEGELCTPTGAAILAEFSASFGTKVPVGKIRAVGRGAGSRIYDNHPNIISAYIIESEEEAVSGSADCDTVDVLETNVDDITGEILANTISKMMDAGARDASAVPVIMKKGRCGYLIRVICTPDASARLAELLAEETGSLGIRCTPMVHRFTAERGFTEVSAQINGKNCSVPVKYAAFGSHVYARKAEFEECRKIAEETGSTVREVKRIFEEAAWKAGENQ